nr:putative folylpolyglutamate synthase [Schizosaccharomyces pombe]O74742.1 RecName: Full=Probable folylpolyglutamate synthase; AltName: Full=Folylpoly-gamma-glutamate synthetase; Short=FPGS; AltName: Full=Tetrahydrofolylpolyglutamate synthase; Short=Tetrahydrofolate synthase [Schizosaccharomyces pombe 972h-]CAA21256.1 folylpolyglutamate synthase (predicted) [Schizosaccharomyces pombe]|eukprot:NP_595450.1 putative folylpolyglutamate synthase [Schizosaccharomyces pombe]
MHTAKPVKRYFNLKSSRIGMNPQTKTFEGAINRLNSLQSNAKVLEVLRKRGKIPNDQSMVEMRHWLRCIGYQPSDLNRLNVIHVAGTKGKGSTCAFTSSILQQIQKSGERSIPKCIGMYTSPHLRSVCERIQLNGKPISQELFTKYFFDVWERLENAVGSDSEKPMYFRFLTLMAWHVFISENVDAAIIEVGIGGEYDSTNLIEKPYATAVTSLGLDHTSLLGNTIAEIAWQKAGIYKESAIALTCEQAPEAMNVLKNRAAERNTSLKVVIPPAELTPDMIGLSGVHQLGNTSLAVSLVQEFYEKAGCPFDRDPYQDPAILDGLKYVKWPGRCQIEEINNIKWCFDGAHTKESLEATGLWLASKKNLYEDADARILLFNQQSRDDPIALLRSFLKGLESSGTGISFTHVIFSTNVTWKDAGYNPELLSINTITDNKPVLHVQEDLCKWWKESKGTTSEATVAPTIQEAIETVMSIKQKSRNTFVCVTGSLHLTGGVFVVLDQAVF